MSLDTTGPTTSAHSDEYACARAWMALTTAHARVAERLSTALAQNCGLSINDFEVMLRLERVPAPGLRLGDLQPAVRLTQPSLSRMITRLERQGWLSRSGDPGDRRAVFVAITPAGLQLLRRAVPVHAQTIGEVLLDRLTPAEQELLAEALTRIAAD